MECAYPALMKIPDQIGFMVICDRTVLISHGDLANREEDAQTISLLLAACKAMKSSANDGFQSITIQFSNYFYVITRSGNQVYVVKRRITNVAATAEESTLVDAGVFGVGDNNRSSSAVNEETA